MKSKRAEEYIEDHRLKGSYTEGDFDAWRVSEAVEIAEEDMIDKAVRVFSEYLSGALPEEIIKKNVEEFKQKLME